MKPWIKILIGVVIGFGAGFGSGFFCHKKLVETEFEEISEEEMAEIENSIQNSMREIADGQQKIDEVNEKLTDDILNDPDKVKLALQNKISYVRADKEAKEKYSSVWETTRSYSNEDNANELPIEDNSDMEEGFDDEFLEMLEAEEVEPGQVMPPHVISFSEYYNERPEYDKMTVFWYEGDHTFLDQDEEVIADIESHVGLDPTKLFLKNDPDEDPDIRFVRYEQINTDFEIIRYHTSFSEITNGGD